MYQSQQRHVREEFWFNYGDPYPTENFFVVFAF